MSSANFTYKLDECEKLSEITGISKSELNRKYYKWQITQMLATYTVKGAVKVGNKIYSK